MYFVMKTKVGKKIHLCDYETDKLADDLNNLFNKIVEVPRMRVGNQQSIDSLICEECLQLAKDLRNENKEWKPRIPTI